MSQEERKPDSQYLAYSAKLRLVITQWVCALHFTIGPVVHDELFENDLASSQKLFSPLSQFRLSTNRLCSFNVHPPFF